MGKADEMYVCIGVKASNYFMPKEVLSDKGPGGGGWIHFNKYMQVVKKPTEGVGVWGDGTVYAVGDCNLGCIGEPPNFGKEIIETTKINECKNGLIGILIWHFVHHTPVNLFARGPKSVQSFCTPLMWAV